MFKTASWFFAPFLGALLFYAGSQAPSGSDSPLTLHLADRFIQKSQAETGVHSPEGAVAGDYRGFDLLAAGFLFSLAAMVLMLLNPGAKGAAVFFPALFWLGGPLLTLGIGFFTVAQASNFLDYEALALWGIPVEARLHGVLLLVGGVLLSFGGLLLMAVQAARMPEVSGER